MTSSTQPVLKEWRLETHEQSWDFLANCWRHEPISKTLFPLSLSASRWKLIRSVWHIFCQSQSSKTTKIRCFWRIKNGNCIFFTSVMSRNKFLIVSLLSAREDGMSEQWHYHNFPSKKFVLQSVSTHSRSCCHLKLHI